MLGVLFKLKHLTQPIPKTTTTFITLKPYFFSTETQSTAITLDLLTKTYGFSPDSAQLLFIHIDPKLTPRPKFDTLYKLFRTYGFKPQHIVSILTKYPNFLHADAETNFKPKLDLFVQTGLTGDKLIHVITNDTLLLRRSLENRLAPCIACLEKFFGNKEDIVNLFMVRRGTWILHKFSEHMEVNINALRSRGVPDSSIAKLMAVRPRTLARDPDKFNEVLQEVSEMGLDPGGLMFIYGIVTLAGMKPDKWMSKIQVFKKYGWSDSQIKALIMKQPKIMDPSLEKMDKLLNFFMKSLGWTPEDICNYPTVLMSSYEKKILPRVSVLLTLLAEGLTESKKIPSALLVAEDKFTQKYVMNHVDKYPQLLDMYRNMEVLALCKVIEDLSERVAKTAVMKNFGS